MGANRGILSDPHKPDQIFRIYYRVINGTINDFSTFDTSLHQLVVNISSTTNNGTAMLEIKFPRNYPYSNNPGMNSGGIDNFAVFVQHLDQKQGQPIVVNGSTTDCFFDFSIPVTSNAKVQLVAPSLVSTGLKYHGDNTIPASCISDTVVPNVPTKKDGTIAPLQQYRAGVAAKDVVCPVEYPILVIRSDGMPYCVNEHILEFLDKVWHHKNG